DMYPEYNQGSDLDIFCKDVNSFAKNLLSVGNNYIEKNYVIKVIHNENSHFHFDIYSGSTLEIRFDLYGELPKYKKVSIKPEFFNMVVSDAQKKNITKTHFIKIASDVNEQVLRYIEFLEFFEQQPAKAKHLKYVE